MSEITTPRPVAFVFTIVSLQKNITYVFQNGTSAIIFKLARGEYIFEMGCYCWVLYALNEAISIF